MLAVGLVFWLMEGHGLRPYVHFRFYINVIKMQNICNSNAVLYSIKCNCLCTDNCVRFCFYINEKEEHGDSILMYIFAGAGGTCFDCHAALKCVLPFYRFT